MKFFKVGDIVKFNSGASYMYKIIAIGVNRKRGTTPMALVNLNTDDFLSLTNDDIVRLATDEEIAALIANRINHEI